MSRLALLAAAIVAAAGSRADLAAQVAPISPSQYQDLSWRCIGPFDGGPVASIRGVAGVSGVYVITTPSGGVWKTIDGGDNWTPEPPGTVASAEASSQWIDPANPKRVVRVAATGIDVSLDAGQTWTTFQHLPIAEVERLSQHEYRVESPAPVRRIAGTPVTVSIADPVRFGLVFAGTATAVYVSFDNGLQWAPLQLNMPPVAITDLDIRGRNLVAATRGRSVWMLEDISPLRQAGPLAAGSSSRLFKPSEATLPRPGDDDAAMYLDYVIGSASTGDVGLDVLDATGRVVHHAQSAPQDPADRWLAVVAPLSTSPGHHRVSWNLRFDPPPTPHHRFAQAARSLFEHVPADPDGPRVLAGTYRVRLTDRAGSSTQPLIISNDPRTTTAEVRAQRAQFDLAMKAWRAMDVAHRGFVQLAKVRPPIRALMNSPDADVTAMATDLDTRLSVIDGSDWTGLIIPDADDDTGEIEEEEEFVKHPDFVPPKAVSLSKDYDDPTSILGRKFANVSHAPALAILATKLGGMVTRVGRDTAAPDAAARDAYAHACEDLAGVLDQWRAINAVELPRVNTDLGKRRLALLPIATTVPTLTCSTGR